MKTSKKEITDLFKAWVAISIAFTIAMRGTFLVGFWSGLARAAFTVGLGFLVHELAHKLVAQRYGFLAEFRSYDMMLGFSVLMSFAGFVFIAPGAVMIRGYPSLKQNAKISSAGILANIAAALAFTALYFTTPFIRIASYGVYINSWLAVFNLIPFGMFDGKKILRWNKYAYAAMAVVSLILIVGAQFL